MQTVFLRAVCHLCPSAHTLGKRGLLPYTAAGNKICPFYVQTNGRNVLEGDKSKRNVTGRTVRLSFAAKPK